MRYIYGRYSDCFFLRFTYSYELVTKKFFKSLVAVERSGVSFSKYFLSGFFLLLLLHAACSQIKTTSILDPYTAVTKNREPFVFGESEFRSGES